MSDAAYSNFDLGVLDKKESDQLEKIRFNATKGNWDEVSKLFSEMPGINSPKGFIPSKDLIHIIDAPQFAKEYNLDASLRAIFEALHYWVYPGRKPESDKFFEKKLNEPDHIYIDIPEGLKVWPREFNKKGRDPSAKNPDEEYHEELTEERTPQEIHPDLDLIIPENGTLH